MTRLHRTTINCIIAVLGLVLLAACGGSRAFPPGSPPEAPGGLSDDGETAAGLPRWVSAANSDKPVARPGAFPATGQAPKWVQFRDAGSYDPDGGSIVKWEWNFADQHEGKGGWHDFTATQGLANHQYLLPGTYNAQLRVTDDEGAKDNGKITITITETGNLNPVAQGHTTPLAGSAPLDVQFDADGSADADGYIAKWEWDLLGNGTFQDYTLSAGLAAFTYVAHGTYNPVLRVTDDNGAVGTKVFELYVNAVPDASATATPDLGYPPMAVSFDGGGSSDPDGSIVNYEWDFGEGGGWVDYDGLPTASHTYYSAGNYTAQLRVTDNAGATASAALSVDTTQPPPNVPPLAAGTVAPQSGTAPLLVHFDGSSSSDSDGQLVSWEWDLADGSGFHDYSTTQGVLDFTYINAGNFVAVLRVTDDDGDSDTESFPLHVNAHPAAQGQALPDSGNAPLPCAFDAAGSADSDGSIVQWEWDFGAGAGFADFSATAGAAAYTYTAPGSFTATLRVTDNEGGQDVLNLPITVTQAPAPTGVDDWFMYGHDAQHTGRSPNVGPATNAFKWAYTLGGQALYSSPVIGADGTVYLGNIWWDDINIGGGLFAVNPDGSLRWTYDAGFGIYASPAIGPDGTLYVGCEDNNLHAINPDGSPKWIFNTGYEYSYHYIHGSPAIDNDGTVYFGSTDGILYAINPDGSLKWAYTTPYIESSSPALGPDGTIYIVSLYENLYAINPDGSLKWSFAMPGYSDASPAVGADGTVYVGSDTGFYAINPDGSLQWVNTAVLNAYASPAIDEDGTLYVLGDKLYAVNPDGSVKWSSAANSTGASPTLDAERTIYIAGYLPGGIPVLNAFNSTGSLKWSFALAGREITTSAAIGANGTVYVGSVDGNLYAIGSGGSGGDSWGEPQIPDSAGDTGRYSSMALVNGLPAIGYFDNANGDLKFVRASAADGSAWGAPQTLDSAGSVGWYTSLEVVNGFPAISYLDSTNGDLKFVRALNANGSAWGAPQIVDSIGDVGYYNTPMDTSLEVVNGCPAISYWDSLNGDLMYVRASDANGGSWDAPQTLDSTGSVGQYSSLAVVNGSPAISYNSGGDRDLKYMRAIDADGGAWGAPVVIDGDAGGSTSLAVVNGFPAISYTEVVGHMKFVRAKDANGSTWGWKQTIDWSNGHVAYPSLAVVDGNPAIAYVSNGLRYVRAANANGSAWGVRQTLDSNTGVSRGISLMGGGSSPAISYQSSHNGNLKFIRKN